MVKSRHLVFIIAIMFMFIAIFYGKLLFQPNHYLITATGDGLKSYFTYTYYISNDKSFINTQSVNYPFGEHFVFLDSQPMLSIPIKALSYIFPGITHYSIGLMHLFMMISIVVASIFIFLILKEYKLPTWLAIVGGVFIVLLSPQFYRINGHFGLSYMWVIPGTWYFLIKFFNNPKLKIAVFTAIFSLITYFLHSYLGFITTVVLLSGGLLYYLFYRKNINLKAFGIFILSTLIPLILYFTIVKITDTHIDRTDSPVGLFVYHASWKTIFLPSEYSHFFLYNWFTSLKNPNPEQFEGMTYVGFFVNISLIISLIWLVTQVLKKRNNHIYQVFSKEWLILFIVGIVFLIISLEKPIEGLIIFLVDFLSPLKQFRALGRFAWIFFYLINIGMMIVLYRIYLLYQAKKWRYIFFIPMLFLILEGFLFHQHYQHILPYSENLFKRKNLNPELLSVIEKLENESYQAIIPLPFYHFGSDDFIIEPDAQQSRLNSMLLTYHLKQKMLACNTGRTSGYETRQILQILLPNFYPKDFKEKVSREPFLIMYQKNEPIRKEEEQLLSKAEKIFETDHLWIGKISWEKLFEYSLADVLSKYVQYNENMYLKNDFLISDTTAFIYYNGFDDNPSPVAHSNQTALIGNKKEYTHLIDFKPNTLKENTTYTVSFWYYNVGHSRTHNVVVVEENNENHQVSWIQSVDTRFSYNVFGNWSFIEFDFTTKNNQCSYKIFAPPIKTWQDTFYIDDLLIRTKDVDVFKVFQKDKKGILLYNNHFIETDIPFAMLNNRNDIIRNYYLRQIEQNSEWKENIAREAKKLNKSYEQHKIDNAQYMVLQTFLNKMDIEEIKINYYVDAIKKDKSWYNHILQKPENKGRNIDSLLIENAKYVIYH